LRRLQLFALRVQCRLQGIRAVTHVIFLHELDAVRDAALGRGRGGEGAAARARRRGRGGEGACRDVPLQPVGARNGREFRFSDKPKLNRFE
jgi:hypothetical protein